MRIIRYKLLLVMFCLFCTACSPYSYDSSRSKVYQERMTVLEQAKNSSDPAVLKQAELVRMDIEQEYREKKQDEWIRGNAIYLLVAGFLVLVGCGDALEYLRKNSKAS